jgi:hypothetical protein
MTKSEYKKRHIKVVDYIYREYGKDFHFNKTKSGSLLIQLSPFNKHEFHLLIKTHTYKTQDSINNIARKVVNAMYESLYQISKDDWSIKYGEK